LGAPHIAPGIGRNLGVRDLLERFLVGLVSRRLGFLLLRRFRLQLRDQIDVGGRHLCVSRPRQQDDDRSRAENLHGMLPAVSLQPTTAQTLTPSRRALRQGLIRRIRLVAYLFVWARSFPGIRPYKRSDLQDFGDCTQSSQIGPHLVQPLRARPSAITLKNSINRLNMAALLPTPLS